MFKFSIFTNEISTGPASRHGVADDGPVAEGGNLRHIYSSVVKVTLTMFLSVNKYLFLYRRLSPFCSSKIVTLIPLFAICKAEDIPIIPPPMTTADVGFILWDSSLPSALTVFLGFCFKLWNVETRISLPSENTKPDQLSLIRLSRKIKFS